MHSIPRCYRCYMLQNIQAQNSSLAGIHRLLSIYNIGVNLTVYPPPPPLLLSLQRRVEAALRTCASDDISLKVLCSY